MVLDSSAILAILQDEPERRKFNEAIEAAETRSLSTASFVECSMIVESRYGADGVRDLDLFIAKAQVSLVSVDEEQADLARRAFRKYGKGRHPAGLNFGDCFSYALVQALNVPLLFKGNDFNQTDIQIHPASAEQQLQQRNLPESRS
jgi:ribonuclease VapC